MDKEEQLLIEHVQHLFTTEMYKQTNTQTELNLCCDDNDVVDIKNMANHINNVPDYKDLSKKDIFIVLIYTYYALRLNEQSTDWLHYIFLEQILFDTNLGLHLYHGITTGDIMVDGLNLSSTIRRHIMEMQKGGKSKKYRRNRNSNKSMKKKSMKKKSMKKKSNKK
jgi:hypothetical protein